MRTDDEIKQDVERDAVEKLHHELPYSSQFIKVTVKDGQLTLDGVLEWNYQLERAVRAVRSVRGVIGVTDSIALRPRATASDVRRQLEEALERSANSTRVESRSRLSAPK
jgi:osmotically-inducible protein OsmY